MTPRRTLWPLLALLLVSSLVLSATAVGAGNHTDQQVQQPAPAPLWRRWNPFSSAVDVGWVLAALLECVGLGAYYIWGGAPQGQQQPQPLAQDDGGDLVPQWIKDMWAQHWPDIQQHLPAPWGHVVAQWHAHGAAAGYVLATLAATAAAGVGWIAFSEQQRVVSMPGCWEHMLAAARAERSGWPWWATYRGTRALLRASSTGPCSGVAVSPPGVWAGRFKSAMCSLSRVVSRLAGLRGADVGAWIQDRAQRALFWMTWTTDAVVDAALALYEHATARSADAAAWLKAIAGWAFGWFAAIKIAITAGVLVLLLVWGLLYSRDYLLEEFEVSELSMLVVCAFACYNRL